MSKEIKTNLQFDAKELVTVDDRVLIKPGPVKEVITLEMVPERKPKKAGELVKTKKEERVTRSNFRIGEVMSVSDGVSYTAGDVVVYSIRDAVALDILANGDPDPECPVLVRKFNIVAKISASMDEIKGKLIDIKKEDNE